MENRFETFTVLLASINRSIRRIKNEEIKKYDLKATHVSCIYFLYKEGHLTSRELCTLCEEDKANISRTIEYLEQKGLIICTQQGQKRYRAALELTEAGANIGKFIANKVNEILDLASEGMSDEERRNLYNSLELINRNLLSLCEEYE